MNAARLEKAAPLFAALGDPTRLKLVARLCAAGPSSISQLTGGATVTRQAITKHLRALELAGVAKSERVGREVLWELETQKLAEVQQHLDQISKEWDARIARLRAFVEKP